MILQSPHIRAAKSIVLKKKGNIRDVENEHRQLKNETTVR